MYSLKNNGDSIAKEFAGLIEASKLKSVTKTASYIESDSPSRASSEYFERSEGFEDVDDEYTDESLDSTLKDMILEPEESEMDYASDMINDDITEMSMYDDDDDDDEMSAKAKYIISGLNKISSSLRAKGESFASDVVLATIRGIKSDMKKEAAKNSDTISALSKIAKDLRSSGDEFAADMVLATVKKLS